MLIFLVLRVDSKIDHIYYYSYILSLSSFVPCLSLTLIIRRRTIRKGRKEKFLSLTAMSSLDTTPGFSTGSRDRWKAYKVYIDYVFVSKMMEPS